MGIDEALEKITKGKLKKVLKELKEDKEVKGYLEQANKLAVTRLGYNDHGEVHSKVVSLNALRMFNILDKKGVKPNIMSEEVGNKEDSKIAILLGAYLHDIGCSVSREAHEVVGVAIALPIINKILGKFYDSNKLSRIACFVCEAVLCHMGAEATSLEAKLVEVADGTDITKGRARIPFHIGKKDIHKFSALAIERVEIKEGKKKPLRVEVFMENPAGIFQTEETMLKKIKDAKFEDYIEIVAKIKGEKEVTYL